MWRIGWREKIWSSLDQSFDLIVIGGGITGGGIFLEAVRAGLKTLLVEAHDFASGTSSRSSKLVHGGFRYLRNGQIKITLDSVREREHLLREGRGLINQIGFIIASYKGDRLPMWTLGLGLTLYDLLALRWGHKYYDNKGLVELCPNLNPNNLLGGYRYFDALTDDARLVLKTIKEGVRLGGLAINYAQVDQINRTRSAQIVGVQIQDMACEGSARFAEVKTKAVINATGAWADSFLQSTKPLFWKKQIKPHEIRRLRGSHLVFPSSKLPVSRAISIWHPRDKRPVFTFPWEGVTLVGTTDVDYLEQMETNPCISQAEVEYLLEVVQHTFPSLQLGIADVQSTFSGIRSVVDTGKSDPSKESREHILWYDNGLLTITGGKLTTFRLMAKQALNLLEKKNPQLHFRQDTTSPEDIKPRMSLSNAPIEARAAIRLIGRYGSEAAEIVEIADSSEFTPIESSQNLWAEIRWAARTEGIVHLEDLLLRRVRLGIVLPGCGLTAIHRIKNIVQQELGWTDERWDEEICNYKRLIEESYSVRK
jgi:glycerol-3-phosphate dehydrogenase